MNHGYEFQAEIARDHGRSKVTLNATPVELRRSASFLLDRSDDHGYPFSGDAITEWRKNNNVPSNPR